MASVKALSLSSRTPGKANCAHGTRDEAAFFAQDHAHTVSHRTPRFSHFETRFKEVPLYMICSCAVRQSRRKNDAFKFPERGYNFHDRY